MSLGALAPGQDGYYTALGKEDYYTSGGEPPGRWFGRGASALSLTGQVVPGELSTLFKGYSPHDRRPLGQNAGKKDRRPGWDATFSAPKSVSTLWAIASPTVRKNIQDAHAAAVENTLAYFENHIACGRIGKEGLTKVQAGIVAALFDHSTSRALDPNLHTHCLILNVAIRPDGGVGGLDSRDLYQRKMLLGALYRAQLSFELEKRLGISLHRDRAWFEAQGVPATLMQEFSKRRAEILEKLGEIGASAARAAVAALETRSAKESLPREQLFRVWEEAGQRHSFTQREAYELLDKALPRHPHEEMGAAVSEALTRLTTEKSHFTAPELLRYIAEDCQARGLSLDDACEAAEHTLSSEALVHLGNLTGEKRYTTLEMWEMEADLLTAFERSRHGKEHVIHGTSEFSSLLSEEQFHALDHLLEKEGSITCLTGMAGTGKSFLMAVAKQSWEAAGYSVLGCALAGKAAEGLETSAQIPSSTIHRLLIDLEQGNRTLSPRSVLVVDEAGMVPTRLMAEAVERIEQAGSKLILLGDAGQLQPVEAGAPFRAACRILGDERLVEIRRQREEWARSAVMEFASGRSEAALLRYAERGLVEVTPTPSAAIRAVAQKYCDDGLDNVMDKLALASTREDVRVINNLIQRERKEACILGRAACEVGENTILYTNDRVLFTRNSPLFGVKNGSLGTVTEIHTSPSGSNTLSVSLDSGDKVRIPTATYTNLELGYCVTSWKAQGATVDRAFVLTGGSSTHRELTYVESSRARDNTHFVVAEEDAGERLTRLAQAMSQSRAKDLAHDIAEEVGMEIRI